MATMTPKVRMQYFRMAKRALMEGKLSWLASTAAKTLAVPISDKIGRPLAGPVMGNLVLTYRCNNACFMCDLPKPWLYESRGQREFTVDEWKQVIDDMATIGVVGLSFAGGEPTIHPKCFELMKHSSSTGLFTHLNTNGYNLHRPKRIHEFLATSPESMNFSLDAATPELHDRLRGAPGSFDRVAKATELLLEARQGRKPAVTYTFVVGPDNCEDLPRFVELARSRGIDSVSFNPLTPSYKDAKEPDPGKLRALDQAIDWLRAEKKRDPNPEFIDNSDTFLSLFPDAVRAKPSPLKCYVGYHSVIVDCFGNVYACTVTYQQGKSIGNVRETPLPELWKSAQYQQRREELSHCKECYWNCHTEINLLYQRAPRRNSG